MLTVNCGAIPEGILESELFGHEKGAFTGAVESRKGYFELADDGTLFLDEIGEMPIGTQVKLLRVLESHEFLRVGGTRSVFVNVRVIAATNKDLEVAIRRESFRKDLYYRLNTVTIMAPPLRSRREDIRLLAEHFAETVCKENGIRFEGFTEAAYDALENYPWPGNIRELRNLVERMLVLEKGRRIGPGDVQKHLGAAKEPDANLPVALHISSEQSERELIYRALIELRMGMEDIRNILLEMAHPTRALSPAETVETDALDDFSIQNLEKTQIEKALARFDNNRKKAARALGIGERTLYRKLKEYGLDG
jgi:DNA-binding NtrC family response regulator